MPLAPAGQVPDPSPPLQAPVECPRPVEVGAVPIMATFLVGLATGAGLMWLAMKDSQGSRMRSTESVQRGA